MILEETMLLVQLDDCDGTAVKDYYAEMLANGDEEKPYSGFSYTFCYIRESDGKVIGMLNLRPEDGLIGTIGYSIRPSERGKGYGTALLEQGLELCEMFGITPVAVVRKDNAASIRVLEKNGFEKYGGEYISEKDRQTSVCDDRMCFIKS